jgi:alkylation response protein AidB-like acyl-CoA dehydrogenase
MPGHLENARELLPLISRLRDDTEAQRRLAAPVVDALRRARLCRGAVSASLGGLELRGVEPLLLYEILAGAEASVSWIAWNNALPGYFSRFFSPGAREEVYANADWLYACSTRPTGRAAIEGDAYRVKGRWSLVSGCEFADWLALRCVIEENGAPRMLQPNVPEVRMVWMRRSEVEILDTWRSGGLRGTGSHDVVVSDRMVPRRLTLSPLDGSTLGGTLGRVPIVCNLAAGFAAQLLGLGGSAMRALMELASTKAAVDAGPALGERPAVFAAVAEQGARLAASREHLHATVTRLWTIADSGRATESDIAAVFAAAHNAMTQGRAAVAAAYSLAGASALYTSSPLERMHRDLHAMAAHVIAQPHFLEDTGRVQLGLKPLNPLYLV